MKGSALLLAVLLAIFLAAGQCGAGSHHDDGYSNSSKSDDDHEDEAASHDDSDDSDDSDDKDSDEQEKKKKDDSDDGSAHAATLKRQLESDGVQVEHFETSTDDDCAAHSYGEVRNYFADHQCRRLERAWYELGDEHGSSAVMSVAWVEMPDAEDSNDVQRLVDRPGTGNVRELSQEDGPHQDVHYSGWYYRSGRDGNTFVSVQAEPLADNQGSRDLAREASGATASD